MVVAGQNDAIPISMTVTEKNKDKNSFFIPQGAPDDPRKYGEGRKGKCVP